ncbi:MAG: hypothetical protein ACK5MW_01865 [Enterococcus sp.]
MEYLVVVVLLLALGIASFQKINELRHSFQPIDCLFARVEVSEERYWGYFHYLEQIIQLEIPYALYLSFEQPVRGRLFISEQGFEKFMTND